MLGGECGEEAPSPAALRTCVVDLGAKKRPSGFVGFLTQGEDMNFVAAGEAFDQPEERVDDALLAGAVDAAVKKDGELHGRQSIGGDVTTILRPSLRRGDVASVVPQ